MRRHRTGPYMEPMYGAGQSGIDELSEAVFALAALRHWDPHLHGAPSAMPKMKTKTVGMMRGDRVEFERIRRKDESQSDSALIERLSLLGETLTAERKRTFRPPHWNGKMREKS